MTRSPSLASLGIVARIQLWALLLAMPGLTPLALAQSSAPDFDAEARIWRLARSVPPPHPATESGPGEPAPDDASTAWFFEPSSRVHPQDDGQHLWADLAAGPGGMVGVAWMDDHAAGGFHVYYAFSTDGGMNWSMPERVDDRTSGSSSRYVSLAYTPAGVPIAVWEDDRGGHFNLYFSKRTGRSPHWAPGTRINMSGSPPGSSDAMNGSLTVLDDQRIFVAWTDWREGPLNQVYVRATRNSGATWGPETRVSDGLGYQPVAADPCLIADPSSGPVPGQERLYCVTNDWRGYAPGGRYPNVCFYQSLNGGATWSEGVRVNDVEPYYQQVSSHALVCLGDGRLACGWLNNPDFTVHRYDVSVSTNDGATWGPGQRVDEPTSGGTDTHHCLVAAGMNVMAGFAAADPVGHAYLRVSPDGAASWPDAMLRIDDVPPGTTVRRVALAAISPDAVQAAWEDVRPPGPEWKIYASRGTNVIADVGAPGGETGHADRLALRVTPNPCPFAGSLTCQLHDGAPLPGYPAGADGAGATAGIYAITGQRVGSLRFLGGQARWDGRDPEGRPVPAGVYWLRLDGSGGGRAAAVIIAR
jgi:hypothetical protein